MLNHISATDLQLFFETKLDGEFVVPDAGSLRLTIRGADGSVLPGYDQKLLPDTALNTVSVLVPAAANTLAVGESFEARFAQLDFISHGKPGRTKVVYRVIRFSPYTVTEDNVRETLGVSLGELPDSAIDLFQTHTKLSSDSIYALAIASSQLKALYANDVLRLTEALNLAPSLRARILKQEEKDNALYTRFNFDFNEVIASLQSALLAAEGQLVLSSGSDAVNIGVTIFVVSAPLDPVTGT